ncbi:hypothetical protein RRG08_060603 [Elysia crispata]|uniref:Dermatopontin n=2 Tax=Elysia crispata TaxID=231223 RepID=A0AAE1ANS7_9GAST|nr:hypothetical protein RRG08_060603 [Elysia crispata]
MILEALAQVNLRAAFIGPAMEKGFFRPLPFLLVTLAVTLLGDGVDSYDTDWDEPFLFTCPYGKVLTRLYSVHSNRREDRRWDFTCSSPPAGANPTSCYWTGYVNYWDEPLSFQCSSNHIIAGVNSYHSNRREDRRFKFKCCSDSGYTTRSCYLTGYINAWDSTLDYTVPSGKVLTGAYSVHSNRREDRRWKFHICSYGGN